MIQEAIYVALSLFVSLSSAQMLSWLLTEDEKLRKVNFILVLLIVLVLFYKANPKAFSAFSLLLLSFAIPSGYSATFFLVFIIFFLPFLIPLVILFSRGDVWLLADSVVRFLRNRPLRTFLNIFTIFLITSACISVVLLAPSISIYEFPINKKIKEGNYVILMLKRYTWFPKKFGQMSGYVMGEEWLQVSLDLRSAFMNYIPVKSTCDIILVNGKLNNINVLVLITNLTMLRKLLMLPKGSVLIDRGIKQLFMGHMLNLQLGRYSIKLKIDNYFEAQAFNLLKDLKIIDCLPQLIIDERLLNSTQFLEAVNEGVYKAVIFNTDYSYVKLRNYLLNFITYNYYEVKGRYPYVITPFIIFLGENCSYELFTLGSYVFLRGNIGYLILTVVFIFLIIFSSLLSSIYERGKEYSIMSCMGASPKTISILLLLEAIYIASIGSLATLIITVPMFKHLSLPIKASSENFLSAFIISVITAYSGSLLAFSIIRMKGILKVTPSGLERISVKRHKDKAIVEIPLKLATDETESFINYIVKHSGKRVQPGLDLHEIRKLSSDQVEIRLSYGVDREAAYNVKIRLFRNKAIAEIRAMGPWRAEHTQYLNDMVRALRKFLISYRVLTSRSV